jgi:hypothetical protein
MAKGVDFGPTPARVTVALLWCKAGKICAGFKFADSDLHRGMLFALACVYGCFVGLENRNGA